MYSFIINLVFLFLSCSINVQAQTAQFGEQPNGTNFNQTDNTEDRYYGEDSEGRAPDSVKNNNGNGRLNANPNNKDNNKINGKANTNGNAGASSNLNTNTSVNGNARGNTNLNTNANTGSNGNNGANINVNGRANINPNQKGTGFVNAAAASAPTAGGLVPSANVSGAAPNNTGLVERIYVGQTKADISINSAKKKMIDEAIAKTSEALVLDLIGPERYQKSKTDIQNKVIKQTGRFIPVLKTGEVTKDADGFFNLSVTMQVSLKNLEAILKEQGLLYETQATPIILPLISYHDQVQNKSFRWWRSLRDADQAQQYSNLEKYLQKSFGEQGFYVERPNGTNLDLLRPAALDKDNFTSDDWAELARVYKVSAFIEGEIRVIAPSGVADAMGIEIQLLARQVSSGKVLAELLRKGQWDKKDFWNQKKVQQWVDSTFRDLAVQVKESWQRGTFSSQVVKLIVKGGLPLARYQKFKDQVQSQSRSVRQIRERLIGSDELVFDIEVNGNVGDLSQQLQSVIFDNQKFQLLVSDVNSITLIKAPVN